MQKSYMFEAWCVFKMHHIISLDTGHTLIGHETLRRRPGRTLNVLGTFNLRPVYRGYELFTVLFGSHGESAQ